MPIRVFNPRYGGKKRKALVKRGANRALYGSGVWRRASRNHRDRHPFCVECGLPGGVTDHITPIEDGGEPLDEDNFQTLCASCHNRKHPEKGGKNG